MDFEESTVETQETEAAADDAQFEALEEETDTSESLDSVIGEEDEEPEQEEAEEEPEAQGTSEPGWMRRRIDKAVSKAVAETEQRLKAQYEQQFAPLMERMLEQEAKELVRQGEFKSLDRAKEYLQLKQGIRPGTIGTQKADAPRDEQGRFQRKEDAAVDVRARMMAEQAMKVQKSRGVDVLAEYYNNAETRQKVIDGEWDFYDVADELSRRKAARPKAPAPMRSPNGASGSEKSSIATMSDEQFKRLEARISEGTRYKI